MSFFELAQVKADLYVKKGDRGYSSIFMYLPSREIRR